MKKKVPGKVIYVIMTIIVAALACIGVWGYVSGDREPPNIIIEDTELSYKKNDSYDSLLESVKAVDDVDGEVPVYVENVYPLYGKQEAKIYFTATDSSGNVAKESVIVHYIQDDEEETDEEVFADGEELEDSAEDAGEEEDGEIKNSETRNSNKVLSDIEDTDAGTSESEDDENEDFPQVILTTDLVELSVGERFIYTSYIEDLIDDKDSYSELERRIGTVGASINTYEKGTYNVTYTVKDTDGNTSEPAILTVVVR